MSSNEEQSPDRQESSAIFDTEHRPYHPRRASAPTTQATLTSPLRNHPYSPRSRITTLRVPDISPHRPERWEYTRADPETLRPDRRPAANAVLPEDDVDLEELLQSIAEDSSLVDPPHSGEYVGQLRPSMQPQAPPPTYPDVNHQRGTHETQARLFDAQGDMTSGLFSVDVFHDRSAGPGTGRNVNASLFVPGSLGHPHSHWYNEPPFTQSDGAAFETQQLQPQLGAIPGLQGEYPLQYQPWRRQQSQVAPSFHPGPADLPLVEHRTFPSTPQPQQQFGFTQMSGSGAPESPSPFLPASDFGRGQASGAPAPVLGDPFSHTSSFGRGQAVGPPVPALRSPFPSTMRNASRRQASNPALRTPFNPTSRFGLAQTSAPSAPFVRGTDPGQTFEEAVSPRRRCENSICPFEDQDASQFRSDARPMVLSKLCRHCRRHRNRGGRGKKKKG